jgi:hypothetical protein
VQNGVKNDLNAALDRIHSFLDSVQYKTTQPSRRDILKKIKQPIRKGAFFNIEKWKLIL